MSKRREGEAQEAVADVDIDFPFLFNLETMTSD